MVRTGEAAYGFGEAESDVAADRRTSMRLDLRTTMPGRLRLSVLFGGKPADDGMVEIVRVTGEENGVSGLSIESDGKALMGGVAPGRVHLSVSGPDRRWAWTDPREIEIAPGQVIALDVAVPIVERTLVARDASGALVANAEILVLAGESPAAVETSAKTDAAGRVKLGVPAGAVHLRLPDAKTVTIELGAGSPEPFEVRLPRP